MEIVKEEMAEMAAQHKLDMSRVEEKLSEAIAREVIQEEDAVSALKRISALEAAGLESGVLNASLRKLLASAKDDRDEATRDLDDANDKIAGLVARHARKLLNVKEEYNEAEVKERGKTKKKAAEAAEEQEALMDINRELRTELSKSNLRGKRASDERDRISLLMQTMKLDQKAQLDTLKLLLSTDKKKGAATLPPSQHRDLLEELAQSQEARRISGDTVSELRLEIEALNREKNTEASKESPPREKGGKVTRSGDEDVREEDNSAQQRQTQWGIGKGGASSRSCRPIQPEMGFIIARTTPGLSKSIRPSSGLSVIKEVETEDSSSLAGESCATSVLEGGDVGDISDFTETVADTDTLMKAQTRERGHLETIAELEAEVALQKAANDLLKEDAVDVEARHMNSRERLRRLLASSRNEEETAIVELAEMKNWMATEEAKHKSRMDALQAKLERALEGPTPAESSSAMPSRKGASAKEVGSLRAQLAIALEGRRLAERRVQELNLAMTAMERSYENELLRWQQQVLGEAGPEANVLKPGALGSLRAQLQKSREDYNVLANDIECKEVHWSSTIDMMKREHAEELLAVKRKHNQAGQESEDLKSRCAEDVKLFEEQIVGVREVVWKMIQSFPGALAFRCDLEGGCNIVDYTSSASVFGEACAPGRSLLPLAEEAWRQSGLMDLIDDSQETKSTLGRMDKYFEPGFGQFSPCAGSTFSADVVAARFTPISGRGIGPGIMVVLHPRSSAAPAA